MNPEDKDPIETSEWLDAINSVIEEEGVERASFLMTKLAKRLNEEGAIPTYNLTTPFRNSIPVKDEAQMPGDLFMERRIRSLIRWNALALVLRANKNEDDLGGHISTFSSAASSSPSCSEMVSIAASFPVTVIPECSDSAPSARGNWADGNVRP